MIAIGIGCRKDCAGAEIVDLVRRAFDEAHVPAHAPAALFAPDRRRESPGVGEAARALGLPLTFLAHEALAAASALAVTRSARSLAETGLDSVAEAAALAGAGAGGRLILPRIASPAATCALAASEGTP